MKIASFPVGALGCNCSVVWDENSREALVVDPGGDFPRIQSLLGDEGLSVKGIVHTHTHIDHVGATAPLQSATGAGAHIHEADRFLYDMLPVQAAMVGIAVPEKCDLLGDLIDGFSLRAGGIEMGVLHTPGHTPGSVSFLISGGSGGVVFTGDTLFKMGIGRTDLWGGDGTLIMRSLRERLMTLSDDVVVVPGHGPRTTIGSERRANPFLAE